MTSDRYRNRAVTDLYEPGSTIKPFIIAAALEAGIVQPTTVIDTSPGTFLVGAKTIRDARNYGRLTVAGVIKKSSNVGAAHIALRMQKQKLWDMLSAFGFGGLTGISIPGEVEGQLPLPARWTPIDHASLAYGYGLSTTTIQLARAYATLANRGVMMPLSLLRVDSTPRGTRIVSESTSLQIQKMMEGAVHEDGTGSAADVPYYRIAGKTGTIHKFINGAYSEDHYTSLFAGFAPASDPQLVMVVTIDDPRRHGYYGGQVAAPVFSSVMAGALRLMNITPDDTAGNVNHLVQNESRRAG
jgi:cell division protein FtsI (penicillin-binding protein 3)